MSRYLGLGWVRPHEASRVVSLTAEGRRGLRDWLMIETEELT
jgi:hypothetical protein